MNFNANPNGMISMWVLRIERKQRTTCTQKYVIEIDFHLFVLFCSIHNFICLLVCLFVGLCTIIPAFLNKEIKYTWNVLSKIQIVWTHTILHIIYSYVNSQIKETNQRVRAHRWTHFTAPQKKNKRNYSFCINFRN